MRQGKRLIAERKKKLEKIKERKINPYPWRFCRTHLSCQIKEDFEHLHISEQTVAIAGRIISIRGHGRASFAHLQDSGGKIQIYLREDLLGKEAFDLFRLVDIGDFLGVKGKVFRTRTGEITLKAEQIEILSKSLRPLPVSKEKCTEDKKFIYDKFSDKEQRYRRRYLDLAINPEVAETFKTRAEIIKSVREVLEDHGFLEVETPVLQTTYGGAYAYPFKTYHRVLKRPLYLKISPELYLKRIIIGGIEKVYEIGKNFRNEGIDRIHNPEFTMLEAYQAYADFGDMMDLTEEIFKRTALRVHKDTQITYQGRKIDLKKPWRRLKMTQALRQYAELEVEQLSDQELKGILEDYNIPLKGEYNRGLAINALFEHLVEKKLIEPTFVTNYPRETSPLCKGDREDPLYIERFEPFIGGMEFGNAYSELNEPVLQRKLLEEQAAARRTDEETPPLDEDFIEAVEYGMPPTGGLGLGIDRLVMLLTDQPSLKDVILFPQMKS